MAMAAAFGGIVITFPWIGGPAILGHCIAEAFGPKYGVAHGVAVGVGITLHSGFQHASLL